MPNSAKFSNIRNPSVYFGKDTLGSRINPLTELYWKNGKGYKEKMVLTIVFIILSLGLFSAWTLGLHLLEELAHL